MLDWCSIEPSKEGITVVKCHRCPSCDEGIAVLTALAERKQYHLRLYDFRSVDFRMSRDDIMRVVKYSSEVFTEPNKAAFLVDSDLSYGVLRVLATHRDQPNHSSAKVFRSHQAAWNWLLI